MYQLAWNYFGTIYYLPVLQDKKIDSSQTLSNQTSILSEISIMKTCFQSTMIFLFSTYPMTSKRILQLLPFTCYNICYDSTLKHCVSIVKVDLSLKCLAVHLAEWLLYVIYVCIIMPAGFPMLILFCLCGSCQTPKHNDPYIQFGKSVAWLVMLNL